jgi:hypothetical protein
VAATQNFVTQNNALSLPAGDYVLTIDGATDATGPYSFRMVDLNTAAPLTLGTQVNGQLNPGNETDLYKFTVNAGDRFQFNVQGSSGGSLQWRLVDPFGGNVFGPQGVVNVGPLTLNVAGTYTLAIEGSILNTSPVNYTFTVLFQGNVPPTPLTGTALALNQTTSGTISVANEVDTFKFTLGSRAQLYFDSLQNVSNLTWSLTGPAGQAVTNRTFPNSDAASISGNAILNVPAGNYVLTVQGTGAAVGPYSFRLVDLLDPASSTPITLPAVGTPATATSGTLTPGNRTDLYRFTATLGSQFYFNSLSVTGGTGVWRLIDPFGNLVFGPTSLGTDVDTLTLNTGGTYILAIEGAVGNSGSVNYSFAVQPTTS